VDKDEDMNRYWASKKSLITKKLDKLEPLKYDDLNIGDMVLKKSMATYFYEPSTKYYIIVDKQVLVVGETRDKEGITAPTIIVRDLKTKTISQFSMGEIKSFVKVSTLEEIKNEISGS
jgi:hypothetical protein